MSRKDRSLWAIFGAPLWVFVLSLTGLIGALLEDGARVAGLFSRRRPGAKSGY